MELMQTLGVDAAEAGQVAVTASSGAGDGPDSGATVVNGSAATLSAAVLGLQSEGASYLYFGHVGQLLAGEELARRGYIKLERRRPEGKGRPSETVFISPAALLGAQGD